ncbi:MAG: ImmA/IrrE family metallo-endopeptidase [Gemmatimonadota bacterium]
MEHLFVPERLTVIREAREWSRKDLADRVGVTPAAITQFENGDAAPSDETVRRLADVLGVRPEFFSFTLPTRLTIERCHFRQQRSAGVREKRKVVANGQLRLEIIERLADYLTFPSVRIRHVSIPVHGATAAVENLAEDLRQEWSLGPGPIANMIWLLENLGAVVLELASQDQQLDAFSGWSSQRPVIFLVSSKSASRRRFDAAHELGHLLLHSDAIPGDKILEAQADRFAGAFLLPRAQFEVECPRTLSWGRFIELKERWNVSLAALVTRAHQLEIFGEATYRRAYVQLNRRGWRWDEPAEGEKEQPSLVAQASKSLAQQGLRIDEILRSSGLSKFDVASLIEPMASELPNQPPDPNVIPFARPGARGG